MSSYRSSYTPWKSSLGSSYKPSGSSAYTSRDDIGSSRYSSLASPSTYRPSFSSGTYRIKRDPPSSLQTPSYTSRYTPSVPSRTTPVVDSSIDINGSKSSQLKRYTTTATGSISKYGSSREPSPAALEITNRMRSREPSPVSRALRGKSRDPSPVVDSSCKIGYGGLNSYRMSTPKPASTTSYNARYGSGTAIGRASTVAPSILPDKSISYLTASDFHARSASRARETAARKSNEKELEEEVPAEQKKLEEKSESESSSEEEEQETFISVSVVTRATSPTPPGSATTVQRTRRMDIAKTIEKTILRSTSKRATLEKEIQSDRLDDSTRYSRFGLNSRVPSYSPHSDSRYSSTNLRYSSSPLSTVSKSTASSVSTSSSAEPKKEVTASGGKTPRAAGNAKSKLSPPKAVRLSSRQSSVENLTANTNANKPPTAPKAESPTKSSSSSGHAPTKLPNKDFRKSALNVGPTDRPRKSRTPSSGTDSDAVQHAQNDVVNGSAQSKERSPSAGSEASNVSTTSSRRGATGENKARPRCHAKKSSSSASSLSRHNSCNNLKNNSHKLCSPSSSSTSSSTSAGVSSSSGAESSGEQKKINKKHGKKKNLNTHNKNHAANNSSVTKSAATGTGDSNDLTSQRAADENSKAAQPPPLLNAKEPRATQLEAAAEAAESSRTNSRSPLTSLQEKTSNRLQKLSSVSNFFVARQSDANSEPIFIESSENSGGDSETGQLIGSSLTAATNSNTSRITNATTTTTTSTDPASVAAAEAESATTISKRNCYNSSLDSTENTTARSSRSITKYSNESQDHSRSSETKSSSTNFPNETTVTETALTSEQGNDSYTTTATTSAEEQEESSWWQDTSRQINTASALGYHQKDDMRFKLRHIDSGETGWWLRNDEDDTLADDDLRTLNQEEEDHSEATTNPTQSLTNNTSTHSLCDQRNASQTKYSWWTSDNNDGDEDEKRETANAQNENNQNETNCMAYYKANGEGKKIARSHCTPEKPWWGASNENSKGDDNSNGRLEKSNSSGKQNGTIQLKICRVESGEKPWWLSEPDKAQKDCDEEAVVEATIKLPTRKNNNVERSSSSSKDVSDEKRWWMSGPMKKQFTVQRVESGERAWWQQNDEEEVKDQSPQRQKTNPDLARANSNEKVWWQNDNEENEPVKTSRVRALRSDSGEKDWWLQGNEGEDKIQNGAANHLRSEEWNGEASDAERGVDRTDTEVQHINGHVAGAQQQNFGTELSNSFNFEYSERPPPLGQCASPVALERESPPQPPHPPVRNLNQCKSPYDNIPMSKVQVNHYYQPQYTQPLPTAQPLTPQPPYYQQPQQQQQQHAQQTNDYYTPYGNNNNNAGYVRQTLGEKLFISRHQNIDELLGGSCRPLSPLFLDGSSGNSFSTVPANRNLFVEEITPDQVRIHDSTAQMPVIQRMERDEWDNYGGASATLPTAQYEQQLIDDAAIQVYKDGDYGAYLDLESSLAEQAEEIEGLNSSRKNSLVVRTQLSVRVHAIIEKLLSSEGSELRRALFSLKQVFQEDKDLVHAFVALGGLNCLVRVGNGADQNYQNYILRALGQVMLYVDGMNGVMKHEPTMQWLYSLIASNYRSVVKTALKLLLVFVEYAETNCYVLVNAIHAVDKSQGTLPWSNLMRLLKDYDNADAELVIYATSLINKTLAGLNDQDSFYDESDLLEQQGMESVIQRYMSKPGTDLDLLDQLQLYEAVLKFEDGEAEGIRLPENSLRKTQRHRQSTDTAERRKSRRHSTGTSPHVNKVIPSPKRITPTHGVLDEDSSGSTNSAEYANGVFNGEKGRDSVGVTPGLRRRRERAERHKSFLKEQQEAVANGIFAALERREEMGQIVTAIPATVKMGDSPPESLSLTNEATVGINQNQNQNKNSNNNSNNGIHGNHTSNNASSNITANATNNINLINSNSNSNTNTNTKVIGTTTTNNLCNTNNSNSLLSPTRHLLGSNTISIINNIAHTSPMNNNNNNNNSNIKLQSAPEFLTKKNLLMERNATVINGIMKNIQRGGDQLDNNHNNNNNNNNAYKKFENDTNRLNSFYSQLSTPKNQNQQQQQLQPHQQQQQAPIATQLQHQNSIQSPTIQTAHNALAAVLSPKKTLNGFDFTQSTPKTPPNTYEYNLKQNMTPLTSPSHTIPESPVAMECLYDTPTTPITPSRASPFTPSTPSKTLSSPQTPFSSDFTPETPLSPVVNAPQPKFNARVAPPPPPPPPPPPDLLGHYFMMPPTQYRLPSPPLATTAARGIETSTDLISANSGEVLTITESDNEDKKLLQQLKRDHTVKDLTQKLSNMPMSPTHEEKLQNRIVGDMSGLISKAKEGLAKSKSKGEMSRSSSLDQDIKKVEPKKSENELHWEELVRNMIRPLNLCDLDFTDLNSEDEKDVLAPRGLGAGVPPPPPPFGGGIPPPMMPPAHIVCPPPMNSFGGMAPPPMFSYSGYGSMTNSANSSMNGSMNGDVSNTNTIKKNKKTVKLFWKEVREDMIPVVIGKTIWDELPQANVDIQKLEHLFESRAKDLMTKKQQELNKSKEIIVLDHKRSNAINIAMTKLPPPRAIKAAILKMDATVVTREGIDKLLNMLPTDEERGKIQEAQMANPELPLGSAEQFLLTLASISELGARLKLWAFRLDFDNSEKEIAEPLMDLKQGIEILRNNRTFKCILSTLLSVGIFLNGAPVKGFQIEYLSKVPEVKDTVHKHSLLHHLCHMVMESSPDTTDLYSEIGPITRASKADFSDLAHNLNQLETECKASWDRLKLIAKHDCPPQLKQKLVDFLADCAERIIILQIVHRRVINRYRKFLLWLGVPQHSVVESKPNEFCRILSEFALEYRTTRERVQQQLEKKANHRERNKTRGKLIIDMAKFKTKEDRADAELKVLLGTPSSDTADGTLTWRRRRAENLRSPIARQSEENFTDGDDEILESLVKTATKAPGTRTTPRERKRTRHADRKSLKRSRTREGFTVERAPTP
ncbi:uncharacterized protein LOC129242362 isoform X2 [Anastrepha obliqua]|uniref:uncharacterized protein LOC129242362 isoform X2 n=1 Tax=Anastrepha obliqua TaxID=95512 RepID=UPI00240925B9|nr:uncharacterized protein LOC129242362 isoform X2 [Anastrepha obliqua]